MNGTTREISKDRWEKYTGYKFRQVEYALTGLKEKGLEVIGKGTTAKYSWNWTRWNETFRSRPSFVSPNADPKRKVVTGSKRTNGLFLTPIPQSTAQMPKTAVEIWAATMMALYSFFPLIGVLFLERLLTIVRAIFPDVTDSELAQAVRMAHTPTQKTEGLFLYRVPAALRLIRRGPPRETPTVDHFAPDDALERCAAAIRKRGLEDTAAEIEALEGNTLEIESALEGIESRTLRAMVATLTDDQRAHLREAAANDLACMGGAGKFTQDQAGELKTKFFARHARALLKLPRISLMEY